MRHHPKASQTVSAFVLFVAIGFALMAAGEKSKDGLVAHYTFDDGFGTVALDHSGNSNDGKIYGGAEYVKLEHGYALKFDGVDDYVDCGSGESLDIGREGTLELWCYPETPQGGLVTRSTGGDWKDQRLVIAIRRNGIAIGVLSDGSDFQTGAFGALEPKVFTHLAMTWDGKQFMLYRDGRRVAGGKQTLAPLVKGVPLIIGRSQGLDEPFFKGLMDEVKVYSRALSEQEIRKEYDDAKLLYGVVEPDIMGSPVSREQYKMLLKHRFLPVKPEMTDVELAQKLNLDLPQLAEVKAALHNKDAKTLESALAAYMNAKIPPMQATVTGKPPSKKGHATQADDWFAPQITLAGRVCRLGEKGEHINWYSSLDNPDYSPGLEWFPFTGPLTDAYVETGDVKYAERLLTFIRSFYHRCRPPAQKPTSWSGGMGPWSLGGCHRASRNYLPYIYRVIGGSKVMTDADRVMFLKMFYEHADLMYQFAEEHHAHNFESAHLLPPLLDIALLFPEFRESPRWLARVGQRYADNMRDCILDDGGAYERTGYHYAYEGPYLEAYRRMREAGAPLPPSFHQGLEKMCEWSLWVLAPTLEYPLFGTSSLGPMTSSMERAAELFPHRADFAYVASGGKKGQPPNRLARVLPHTGWLTMRSDWSREALYMAVNYNGSPQETQSDCTFPNLLSFSLWAHGRPYITESGSTSSYGVREFWEWCMHTRSSNTVIVDESSQEHVTNGGRLESWASLPDSGPGFTYFAAVSDAYRRLRVTHRRAVLFVRPHYWLIYDRLSGDGKPHNYQWLGHFQPTELTVNPVTKAIATAPVDGKCLWLVPAEPQSFTLEQSSGPIVTREGNEKPPYAATRKMAPYISLVKSGVKEQVAFTVLLCPAESGEAPLLESLTVKRKGQTVADEEAIGCRVRRGSSEDILAMAQSSVLRQYGTSAKGLVTDGEMAYVRLEEGRIVEAALFRGQRLDFGDKRVLEVSPDITSAHLRYGGDQVDVSVKGIGYVSVLALSARKVVLNGRAVQTVATQGQLKVKAGNVGELTLSKPTFSTTPQDLGRAIGVPRPVPRRDAVVVSLKSTAHADAILEYRRADQTNWLRMVKGEPSTSHRFLLTDLEHGKTYQLQITCLSDDGRLARTEATYTHHDPQE